MRKSASLPGEREPIESYSPRVIAADEVAAWRVCVLQAQTRLRGGMQNTDLVVAQATLLSEGHFCMVVQPQWRLPMCSDMGKQAHMYHVSDCLGCVE